MSHEKKGTHVPGCPQTVFIDAKCVCPNSSASAKQIHHFTIEMLFLPCPFCGEIPNVFQVPETRYGPENPYGWVVECKSMGCMFERSMPDQSLKHLMDDWNKRV